MANRPEDNELLFRGPTIDADGHVSRPAVPANEQRFEPPPPEPELELATPTIKPMEELPPEPAPQPKRSRALLTIAVLVAVGVAVLVGALIFKPDLPIPDGVRDSDLFHSMNAAKGQVLITSEPMGAAVFIGDAQVGVTPWAADNRWVGEVKLRLVAKGYAPFETTFTGGRDQTLEIDLQKRERHTR